MPAVYAPLLVEAGSYEPVYWTITDPATGAPVDLTVTGFSVSGSVASLPDGTGTHLLDLPDSLWVRGADGRLTFAPPSATTAAWPRTAGFYQATLTHPSGQAVRVAEGPFTIHPKIA